MNRRTAAILLTLTFAATPLFAADARDGKGAGLACDVRDTPALGADVDRSLPPVEFGVAKRPAILPMLYVSLGALQVYDGHSTMKGLSSGAREANPLMQSIVGSPARFWTIKAATTAASIAVAERMWKRNKVGAILAMAAVNGVSAVVAAHNASVIKQIR